MSGRGARDGSPESRHHRDCPDKRTDANF